ncbi:MAG: peroxidase-related enzyme [Alphaproteobacteria bacterium]|nr:peroxidase-related enzyme [Alphaproteobacteria bacterium]
MRDERVCWVEFADETTASPEVKSAFGAVSSKGGAVENLYKAMALSPHAIEPADQLYKQLLHTPDCPFEPWLRELIALQVAMICNSDYAMAHHGENFHRFYGNRSASDRLQEAVGQGTWHADVDDERLKAILSFNDKLARAPETMVEGDVKALRAAGLSEKEIVYLAQISASFAYWSRIINALGISVGDEPVGLP